MIGQYTNENCMDLMSRYPDKHFDLAIVDPPYGDEFTDHTQRNNYKIERTGGGWHSQYGKKIKTWDKKPDEFYFNELLRVSKNQIIWGANYYIEYLYNHRCFIIWEKISLGENFSMSMCEYAYASFNLNSKIFKYPPQGTNKNKRIHPTQKPVALYRWLLQNYAKPNDLILDTHVGSASSLIACEQLGFKYVGCELDSDYYKESMDRIKKTVLDHPNLINSTPTRGKMDSSILPLTPLPVTAGFIQQRQHPHSTPLKANALKSCTYRSK